MDINDPRVKAIRDGLNSPGIDMDRIVEIVNDKNVPVDRKFLEGVCRGKIAPSEKLVGQLEKALGLA